MLGSGRKEGGMRRLRHTVDQILGKRGKPRSRWAKGTTCCPSMSNARHHPCA